MGMLQVLLRHLTHLNAEFILRSGMLNILLRHLWH